MAEQAQPISIEHTFHALVSCVNALKRVEEPDNYTLMVLESVEPLVERLSQNLKSFNEVHTSLPLFTPSGVTELSAPSDVWCRVDDVKNLWIAEHVVPEHLLYELSFVRESVNAMWSLIQKYLNEPETETPDEHSGGDNEPEGHVRLLLELTKFVEVTQRANLHSLMNYMEFLRKRTTALQERVEDRLLWLANEQDMDANGIRETLRAIVHNLKN